MNNISESCNVKLFKIGGNGRHKKGRVRVVKKTVISKNQTEPTD